MMNCPEETSFLRGRDVSQMKATRPLPGTMPRAGLNRDVSVEHRCRKAWLRHYARADKTRISLHARLDLPV